LAIPPNGAWTLETPTNYKTYETYNLSSYRNLKTSLLAVLCPLSVAVALDSAAQLPTNNLAPAGVALQTDTNGVLLAPTNFSTRIKPR